LEIDGKRRNLLGEIEVLRAERNKTSKGKPSDDEIAAMKQVGEDIKKLEKKLKKIDEEYTELMFAVPNITHPEAPIGGEKNFSVLYTNKEPEAFPFEPKDHEELMTKLDMVDFERGAKVAGSKFYFYKGDAVSLNRSLMHYAMDVAVKHGYMKVETPDMVKQGVLDGSGFNPRGEESQIYKIEDHDLNLIGTAEISMLGFHADEVLDLSDGPKKYAAISHCYRTEAGSYGKATKGLYRVHQFEKLELFVFCKPEESEALHEELLMIEKEICDGLGLPYRVIDTPTGDLGGPAYRKYDVEAWMVMNAEGDKQGGYGEITSCSNCLDYQARRLNIRYKTDKGNDFVHTLNGTAMVLTRFPVAIVENFQNEDGTIDVPEVLVGYIGKAKIE
jgi:seryl-tRNA synthetase